MFKSIQGVHSIIPEIDRIHTLVHNLCVHEAHLCVFSPVQRKLKKLASQLNYYNKDTHKLCIVS